MADLVILAVLAVTVYLGIRRILRDRKNGKHSCGGDCSGCAMRCEQYKGKEE